MKNRLAIMGMTPLLPPPPPIQKKKKSTGGHPVALRINYWRNNSGTNQCWTTVRVKSIHWFLFPWFLRKFFCIIFCCTYKNWVFSKRKKKRRRRRRASNHYIFFTYFNTSIVGGLHRSRFLQSIVEMKLTLPMYCLSELVACSMHIKSIKTAPHNYLTNQESTSIKGNHPGQISRHSAERLPTKGSQQRHVIARAHSWTLHTRFQPFKKKVFNI